MAAPNLASMTYEPGDQPGTLKFYDENEKPTVLFGPPAAELAARIDRTKAAIEQSRAVAPQPVAGPGGGEGESKLAETQRASAASRRLHSSIKEDVFDPKAPFADLAAADQTQVKPVASIAVPQQVAPGGGTPGNLGFGLRRTPDGRIQEFVGGSPGISTEQLKKRDAEAVAQRTSQAVTTTGGFDANMQYLQNKLENAEQRADLIEEVRGQQVRNALAEQSSLADQRALLAQHQSEQQKLQSEIEARVKQDEQIAEQARKEYAGAKVNPERLFQGEGGTLRALTYAISAGLGAFGATLGRTENFAGKAIDGIIERDIRAQEAEIAVKRDGANNAMAQLQRSGLTRDQSRVLLRQIQTEFVSAKAKEMLAAGKIDEANTAAKGFVLALDDQMTELIEKYRQMSLGTRTEQTMSQFAHAKAATSGGWRDVRDQIGTATKLQGIRETDADIDKKRADAAKAQAQGGADEVEVRGYKEKVAQVEEGQAALERIAKMKGLTLNPRTGRYEGDASGTWGTGILGTDADQAYGAQVESLAPGIGRALEGNAPNESTMDSIKGGLLSSSGNKTIEAINALNDRLQEKRRAADALVPQGIVQQQGQRQKQVDRVNTEQRTGVAAPAGGGAPLPAPNRI